MCVCLLASGFVRARMGKKEQCPTVWGACVYSASKRPSQSICRGLTALVKEHICAHCSVLCGLPVLRLLYCWIQMFGLWMHRLSPGWVWFYRILFVKMWVCNNTRFSQRLKWTDTTMIKIRSLKKSSRGSIKESVNSFVSDILIINLLDLRQLDVIRSLTLSQGIEELVPALIPKTGKASVTCYLSWSHHQSTEPWELSLVQSTGLQTLWKSTQSPHQMFAWELLQTRWILAKPCPNSSAKPHKSASLAECGLFGFSTSFFLFPFELSYCIWSP